MTKLTVHERLTLIAESGWPIAWDGCHKIYFLQDEQREAQAKAYGYEVFASDKIKTIYGASCPLRFVFRWGLNNKDFDHSWNIDQDED